MVDRTRIIEEFKKGKKTREIAKSLGISHMTILTHLRAEGLVPKRKITKKVKLAIEAHSLGMTVKEAEKYSYTNDVSRVWMEFGLMPNYSQGGHRIREFSPQLEESEIQERVDFLREKGLEEIIINSKFVNTKTLSSVDVMRESYDFFCQLGANIQKIYRKYPTLITHKKETLKPKFDFLLNTVGINQKTIAKTPGLFISSLQALQDLYQHYVDLFNGNEFQAKKMLRAATSVFGNDKSTIDKKIEIYIKEGIDFHKNYALLEKNPDKVIETRDFLHKLRIEESQKDSLWYYMLLATNKETLTDKIEYCDKEGIIWKNSPKVLVLGCNAKSKPGALIRRVNMIKDAFSFKELPKELDYQNNPSILEMPDYALETRIKKYM